MREIIIALIRLMVVKMPSRISAMRRVGAMAIAMRIPGVGAQATSAVVGTRAAAIMATLVSRAMTAGPHQPQAGVRRGALWRRP